jgi:phosphatidylglycerophosphate synthase
LVALVAAMIGERTEPIVAAAAAAGAIAAAAMDAVDGWLARRTGMASAFGARFDMEVDALLIQVLSILVWTHDKAGAWVVLSGLLRYGFVAAGLVWPWMERPLEPSRRRQTAIAAMALAFLGGSFLADTRWLVLHRREQMA